MRSGTQPVVPCLVLQVQLRQCGPARVQTPGFFRNAAVSASHGATDDPGAAFGPRVRCIPQNVVPSFASAIT